MINKFKYLILGAVLALGLGFYTPDKESSQKDQLILNLVYNVLNTNHFSPQVVNDQFSEKVFDQFLESLDYNKRFLLKSDVENLKKYRDQLDDEIKGTNLEFFNVAYETYQDRFKIVQGYYKEILSKPFDFTKNETIQTDDEKLDYAKDDQELKDRWRKYLKDRVLSRVEERMHDQETPEDDSAGVADTAKVKTFAELEADARKKEMELHDEWFNSLRDMEKIDWVGMYMNAITAVYDPHTQYFPPEKQEDFEISMSGQLEGIGAQLQQKGDYIVIAKIIPGSACWKQGDLEVGDKILKVAEGKDGEAVDMVGMSVRKAVKYIRGPKGTEVRLTVQKMDGSKMVIPIIRDVVQIEATFAKSAVLGEGDNKVGYIRLPKFYVNFNNDGNTENRNCADDVRKEIEKLKKDNVKGIILDLRNNGGGSLQGVIDIVGLFVGEGPVVQVKSPGREPQVLKARDSKVYDGPLVVMVNQFSASASEIFSAAIQDYKRGILIGSKSTFGKGTVQNVLDLDRAVNMSYNDLKPLGALKLTIQKYYRIDGGTPQLRGVHPEIVEPNNYSYIDFGEKEDPYALPYDEIKPADYKVWTKGVEKYPKAISNAEKRIADNKKFQLIDDYAKWLKKEQDETEVSLNYEKYHKEQDKFRQESEKYKDIRKSDEMIPVSSTSADVEEWNSTDDKQKERDKWFKDLGSDIYLHEAFAVSKDLE